jgi:hypothetical protein
VCTVHGIGCVAGDYSSKEGFRDVFGDVVCTGPILCAREWCMDYSTIVHVLVRFEGLECTRPVLCAPEWRTCAWVTAIFQRWNITVGIVHCGVRWCTGYV